MLVVQSSSQTYLLYVDMEALREKDCCGHTELFKDYTNLRERQMDGEAKME